MTLRELINSVNSDQYSDSSLYQKLREAKPEYGIWNLSYSERRMAIVLELTVTLDDDAISNLCCQFPIPADYDGIGAKGSKFVFYL